MEIYAEMQYTPAEPSMTKCKPPPSDVLDFVLDEEFVSVGTLHRARAISKLWFTACEGALAKLPGVVAIGGSNHASTFDSVCAFSSVELLDLHAKEWTQLPAMKRSRTEFAAIGLPGGRILVAGGVDREICGGGCECKAIATQSCEIFLPSTCEWMPFAALPEKIAGASIVSLPLDGDSVGAKVYLVGGAGPNSDKCVIRIPTGACTFGRHGNNDYLNEMKEMFPRCVRPDGTCHVKGKMTEQRHV